MMMKLLNNKRKKLQNRMRYEDNYFKLETNVGTLLLILEKNDSV